MSISCLLDVPWLGIKPSAWVCALTENWTHSLLVYGTMLQPAEPPGQGWSLTLNVNIYILFTYVYHIYVHLSISTNMGMFICNITEHVKYVCEIRSFFAGWTLFLLSSFYHYELNCVVQSCLLPYWQSRASKLQWVVFLHTPKYPHFFLYWFSQFLMTMFKNISRNFPFTSFDRFPDSIPIKGI